MSIQASRTVAGVIVLGIIAGVFWYMKRDTASLQITSYEECADAGYAILHTSPEQCQTPEGIVFTRTESTSSPTGASSSPDQSDTKDLIRVSNVTPNQTITSPLTVKGQARGNWFFEASFPVKIIDGNGQLIAQMPAQALSDWMTSEFVPFSVTLTFAKPTTATGTLLLHNDNPSGAPENDRFISIPIRF